ncbi:MAG: hypothetical protein JOZ73_00025 [Solirubrobacterales bacterium]|nr:hypothetical protein [Solirubrobacterales bacterium]
MFKSTHRLDVWIERASEPISGALAQPGGEPSVFAGWIELTAAIEAVRRGDAADLQGAIGERRTLPSGRS